MIGRKLGKIFDTPGMTTAQKMDEIQLMSPLLEVGLSLTLVYQNDPRLFTFLAQTISSGQALDNMILWLERYVKRLESEVVAEHKERLPVWVALIIPQAYADQPNIAKGRFVAQLTKLLDGIDLLPSVPDVGSLAPKFNGQLQRFLKLLDNVDYRFVDVPEDMDVIHAFIVVGEMGGVDTVNKFARHGSYRLGLTKQIFSNVEFIKAFADMPLTLLPVDAQKKVAGLINTFENSPKMGTIAKGNIAHVLAIADMLKGSKYKIVAVEKWADELITASGAIHKGRRIDIRVELAVNGGKKIADIEIKNWLSTKWKGNLTAAMSKSAKATGETAEETGQLYTDILRYMNNGNAGQQWMFTPDVIEAGVTKAEMEDKIIKHIEELIDKEQVQTALAREFGIDLLDDDLSEQVLKNWDAKIINFKMLLKEKGLIVKNSSKFMNMKTLVRW